MTDDQSCGRPSAAAIRQRFERLAEIGHEVVDILDADGQRDEAGVSGESGGRMIRSLINSGPNGTGQAWTLPTEGECDSP